MTTKRTHGPCTCEVVMLSADGERQHFPDCPAQQEPDALTRLVRYVRASTLHEVEKEEALALISEARSRSASFRTRAMGTSSGPEKADGGA